MNTHNIDGFKVNSSFDYGFTETLIRSFLAMAQAFEQPGFDTLPESEQEQVVEAYYQQPLPSPLSKDEKDFKLKEPILFQLDSGEKIVINSFSGEYYVLLESEMLSFSPKGM